MGRFPVTNREYSRFLDALVQAGREEDALRFAPRERAGRAGQEGAVIYGRRSDGGFELVADADGDRWGLDWSVCMVNWDCANAYVAHERKRTGLGWRLPGEFEWEKVARGVDGRFFPWGDGFDPSWCCMGNSHQTRRLPNSVESFPVDESVYGVRGLAGNMSDWAAGEFSVDGPVTRGARLLQPVVGELNSATREQHRVARGGARAGCCCGAGQW